MDRNGLYFRGYRREYWFAGFILVALVVILVTSPKISDGPTSSQPITPSINGGLVAPLSSSKPKRVFQRYTVLFLTPYHVHTQHMDRWFEHIVSAAQRNPRLEVIGMWGEGWEGWKKDISIADNIYLRYGKIDVIHTHELHDPPTRGTTMRLISGFYHEQQCYDGIGKCTVHPHFNHVHTGFLSYANSMIYYFPFTRDVLLTHLPHAASPTVFKADVNSKRDIDVLLVGKVNNFLYPFREKLTKWINETKIPGQLREHPGYYTWEFKKEKNYTLNSQEVEYAEHIKRAKIVIVTSSIRKYALRKYIEVAMSGALVVGDIPGERMSEFRQFVVEINYNMTAEQVRDILNYYLEHEEERKAKAALGQKLMLERYTYDHFVEGLIEGWDSYLQGKRGMNFPYPTELTEPWCYPVTAPQKECAWRDIPT